MRPNYTHLKDHSIFKFHDLEVETTPTGRFYKTPEGNLYPSVTTVLGAQKNEGLLRWRKWVGNEEADRIMHHASTRGTALHEAVERYCDNEEEYFAPGEMPHVKSMFKSIEPQLKNIGVIAVQEAPLYSDFLGLAGRVDLIGEWDGVPSIVDFKTSSRRKKKSEIKSYFMQATAYAHMFEERTNVRS